MVDREVGRLLKFLKKNNLNENTIIIITGDHGTQSGFPNRFKTKGNTDLSKNFYDDWHHVPLIISGPGINNKETNELCSHMDLAPTLLDMLNIKSPQSFQGKSIYKKAYKENEFVIFENTGNGNCDIKNKKIIIAIRSKELKVIYEVIKFKIYEREVYDMKNDKWELNNLVKENFSPSIRKSHLKIVEQRIKKIKNENNI